MNPICKLISLMLILANLAAYHQVHASQNDDAASKGDYPGYTRVATQGVASRYFIDLESVKWANQEVRFSAVREMDQEKYAIFYAKTNCKDWYFQEEGTQYKGDGTFDQNAAGDDNLQPLKQNPEILAVVKLACDQAQKNRVIIGDFDDGKALELLYGNYDSVKKIALWKSMNPPETFWNSKNFIGKLGLVSVILSQPFKEGAIEKHMLITQAPALENGRVLDCHACGALVSGAVFVKVGNKWKIEVESPYIPIDGSWGKAPEPQLIQIGRAKYGVLFESERGNQGYNSKSVFLIAEINKELKDIFDLITGADTRGSRACDETGNPEKDSPVCYDYDIKLDFIKGKNPDYYDIRATGSGVEGDEEKSLFSRKKTSFYKYFNGKYINDEDHKGIIKES